MQQSSKIVIAEQKTASGHVIGIVTLNNPARLNVTDLEMVKTIYQQLKSWQDNKSVVAVFMQGDGDKAFCAGGDVRRVVELVNNNQISEAIAYFEHEYALDYLIHTYTKPIICWGNGVVMGGGVGLMIGASHRIVTQSLQLSMPESLIGFFPDVGVSYFLNQLPQGVGLYLALTAASLNATDALHIKWADHFIEHRFKEAVLNALYQIEWKANKNNDSVSIDELLRTFQLQSSGKPSAQLSGSMKLIQSIAKLPGLKSVYQFIAKLSVADPWIMIAVHNIKAGSPLSAYVIFEHLKKTKELTLVEVFALDLKVAKHHLSKSDFSEGVRAVLVDKDKSPRWEYASIDTVPPEAVDAFFY
jgi:enoyl-CoA hydratase/carnithine racemase